MPIHEKSLIRKENLVENENLIIDGVDVSGHWSTFITGRSLTDYNDDMQDEIAALPGGENIHRCWQCGSCTNACTVNAVNPEFNPRYWIYLIRLGMEEELLRDKDIIWQCVSCNKCTYACPRDVAPEGATLAETNANLDKVNPSSLMFSGSMMFEYIGWTEVTALIAEAFGKTIKQNIVTYDFARQMDGATEVSTSAFADAVISNL